MQTFLPYPDFAASARVLDSKRLGNQRREALQILHTMTGRSNAWVHHPAVRMWWSHPGTLARYGAAICKEWLSRGYKDTLLVAFDLAAIKYVDAAVPPWLGDWRFHRSHQSNLIRKLPEYYGPMFPGVPDNLPYVWPMGAAGSTT